MATCNPIWETTYDFPIGRVAYVSVSPGHSKTLKIHFFYLTVQGHKLASDTVPNFLLNRIKLY
jgi:hypothetical protein